MPASPYFIYFTVQGRTNAEVVLTDMDVRVLERREAPEGVLLDDPCGDAGPFRWLEIDLDPDPPRVVSAYEDALVDESVTEQERQPVRFPYQVSVSEAETFAVTAYALDCDCDWTIELSWQSQGQTGKIVVDDHGHPFRTVGLGNTVATCSGDGRCEPAPLPEHLLRGRASDEADEVERLGGES